MRLEKPVERIAGVKAQETTQFRLGQVAELEFFERQGFERAALQLVRLAEASRQIVGNVNRDIHAGSLRVLCLFGNFG
jgi:hypothetical protein